MAAAALAKVTEAVEAPVAPDMSKPIRLRYWKLPHTLGTLTQTQIEVDGFVNDGTAQGKVRSIWFYPSGGFAIAELEVGFRPNQLEQDVRIERIVLLNGHGRESSK